MKKFIYITSSLITEFSPGHKPPQVTIKAFTSDGSKKISSLGPALMYFLIFLKSSFDLK